MRVRRVLADGYPRYARHAYLRLARWRRRRGSRGRLHARDGGSDVEGSELLLAFPVDVVCHREPVLDCLRTIARAHHDGARTGRDECPPFHVGGCRIELFGDFGQCVVTRHDVGPMDVAQPGSETGSVKVPRASPERSRQRVVNLAHGLVILVVEANE